HFRAPAAPPQALGPGLASCGWGPARRCLAAGFNPAVAAAGFNPAVAAAESWPGGGLRLGRESAGGFRRAAPGPAPGGGPGYGQVVAAVASAWFSIPASAQQRTMSRMDSSPVTSWPSTTTRWRNPARTMVAAACSSVQSGDAYTASSVRCAAASSVLG